MLMSMGAGETFAARYALLVGNDFAQGNFAQLKYVDNDLKLLKDILSNYCGFDKQHIQTLYNGSPQDMDKSLNSISTAMATTKDNMFLLYYSGHADQNNLKMGNNDYPLVALKQKLSSFPSDMRIGVFDACQSGSFTRIKGGKLDDPFLFIDDGKTKGQVILCSSSINENAQESDALENSVFTFHFVNALRGSADISGDKRVTLSEAYQYSYDHTISSTAGSAGGVQHPSYQFRIQGEGDIVLADLNSTSQGIVLNPDVSGDITIFNANNNVVADLNKTKNSAPLIALGPGQYRIVNSRSDRKYQSTVSISGNAVAKVSSRDFEIISDHLGRKKGLFNQRAFQLGLSIAPTIAAFDFSSLANGLSRSFAAYSVYSMYPTFTIPKTVPFIQGNLDILIRNHFFVSLGYAEFENGSQGSFTGSRFSPNENTPYPVSLSANYSLAVSSIELLTGYKFQESFFKNAYLGLGVMRYDVKLSVSSKMSDSLFTVSGTANTRLNGYLVTPFLAGGYCYPVFPFCDIGIKMQYRIQQGSAALSGPVSSETAGSSQKLSDIRFNFSGFDANIFLNMHFTLNRPE